MATCGVCGGGIGNTLIKHGEICADDTKAQAISYEPEIDDIIKMIEEDEANG